MDTTILRKLLKAGVLELEHFAPGEVGVPQGGVLSPCLANSALDGLEKALGFVQGTFLVRYADDFVIVGDNIEQLNQAKKVVTDFLSVRGLVINEEKTRITSIKDGFDFLGFHFREYPDEGRAKDRKKGIFLVKPSAKNVSNILRKVSETVKKYPNAEPGTIIKHLNPVIRSWAEHFRTVSSRSAFRKVSEHTFRSLLRWVYRKHGRRKKRENLKKYFKLVSTKDSTNTWVFSGHDERKQPITLFQIGSVNFKKHTMIPINQPKNPYLLSDCSYFEKRSKNLTLYSVLLDQRKKKVMLKQENKCGCCGQSFNGDELIQLHHIVPFKDGGSSDIKNLMAVHVECHRQITYKDRT